MQHQAYQDRDWEFSIYVQDATGARIDITASTWIFNLYDAPGGVPVLTATAGTGLTVTDPGAGRIDILFTAVDMAIGIGNYSAELVRTDTGVDVYGTWPVVVSLEGSVTGEPGDIVVRPADSIRLFAFNAPAGKDPWAEPVQVISGSGALAIDYALGKHVRLTVTADITSIDINNWPATGFLGRLTLEITNSGAFTMTGWPGVLWPMGNVPQLTPSGRDHFILTTSDGGVTIYGHPVGFAYQ